MSSIEISLAVLSLTIAGTGAYFTNAAHNLAAQKREDDLFSQRYKLYEEIHVLWQCGMGSGREYWREVRPSFYTTAEINCFADKALYLFDEEIQKAVTLMIMRLQDIGYPGFSEEKGLLKTSRTGFPRELFHKYLNLAGGEVREALPEKSG